MHVCKCACVFSFSLWYEELTLEPYACYVKAYHCAASSVYAHTCFLNTLPYTWFQLALPYRKEETLLAQSSGLPMIFWPFCLHLLRTEIFGVYHDAQFIQCLRWNPGHGERLFWWAHLLLLLLHWGEQTKKWTLLQMSCNIFPGWKGEVFGFLMSP